MNTRKRVLSFILSLVMLLSLLPTAAFAAEAEQQEPALTPTFTQSPVDGVLADDGEGTVQNTDTVPYSGQSHAPDDLVQVIVVLEDESMLSAAGASVQSFAACAARSPGCLPRVAAPGAPARTLTTLPYSTASPPPCATATFPLP